MDLEKNRFLFGVDAPGFDVDEEALIDYFESDRMLDDSPLQIEPEILTIVATRILGGDRSTWATAQRLMDGGLNRLEALEQIGFAVRHELSRVTEESAPDVGTDVDFDESRLRELFDSLPLADNEDVVAAIEKFAAERPLRNAADYPSAVLDRLGLPPTAELLVEQVEEALHAGVEAGVLRYLPGDDVGHFPTLTAGIVLTHRLRAEEVKLDTLMFVASDLAGFAWHEDLSLDRERADGEVDVDDVDDVDEVDDELEIDPLDFDRTTIEVILADDETILWKLPDATFAGFTAGDIVSARVDAFAEVTLDRIDDPSPNPQLVAAIRSAYDAETEHDATAVDLGDLLTTVLASAPDAFSEPQLPLTELCVAAGLEVRGNNAGDCPEAWEGLTQAQRIQRLVRAADDHFDCAATAEKVLEWFDVAIDDDGAVRTALALLGADHVARLVIDELIDPDGVSRDPEHARNVGERLVAVARRGTEFGTAWWVRGVIEERSGDPREAENCFAKGLSADPTAMNLVDRLGWYASDRGDAATAVRMFQRLDDDLGEGRAIAAFAKSSRAALGRNDPCWCGSGRKFKGCHLGVVEQRPLPDRVGWIVHKAFGYLRRHGGEAVGSIVVAAAAWAGDDIDAVRDALDDPIVFDTVLTEGGWWQRFLDDRGVLLPADEVALVEQWLTVRRSVYEVVETHRGGGLDVRDLRTGEQLEVHKWAAISPAHVGDVLLARAVPDGEGLQFVGAVQSIPESQQDYALMLCDDADGDAICGYVGALNPR